MGCDAVTTGRKLEIDSGTEAKTIDRTGKVYFDLNILDNLVRRALGFELGGF